MLKGVRGLLSPLHIPPDVIGNFEIQERMIKKGERINVVNARDAIFIGTRPFDIIAPMDMHIHLLKENGGTWATDHPTEIWQQRKLIYGFTGKVLVGGLGVGLIVSLLEQKKYVKEITVVEKSPEVIRLVQPHLKLKKTTVVRGDLYDFLKSFKKRRGEWHFDFAFYDIWASTGEHTMVEYIRPLRQLSFDHGVAQETHIACWEQDCMIGQLRMELVMQLNLIEGAEKGLLTGDMANVSYLAMSEENLQRWRHFNRTRYAYVRWLREHMAKEGDFEQKLKEARAMAVVYAGMYPFPVSWNKMWKKYEEM